MKKYEIYLPLKYNDGKEIGFTFVSLDLQGYRTGSMNEALGNKTA